MFTIDTEASEIASVLHLKIPNVVLTSPEQFAPENQQRVIRDTVSRQSRLPSGELTLKRNSSR